LEFTSKQRVGTAFDAILIEMREGYASVRISGENAKQIFGNESGAHQWHRCPPTENRGRIHTSVVKVAVMNIKPLQQVPLNDRDIELKTTRGSGNGGQNRNKVETVVVLKHKPSGLIVRCETERSQHQNKILAYEILVSKLRLKNERQHQTSIDEERSRQMGNGHRAEKVRTYMLKYDLMVDHRSGKKSNLTNWLKGKWN
jgi:peptide chain release factor 1